MNAPEAASQAAPSPPLRTWRPMVLWTAALLLALGLAWFVGAVVVPVWQVRRAINGPGRADCGTTIVDRLGGPEKAIAKIRVYLRMPEYVARARWAAALNLCYCGNQAVPLLITALHHDDPDVRHSAAVALCRMKPAPTEAAPALIAALRDEAPRVRLHAAWTLAEMGPTVRDAIPALERTLTDREEQVRLAAAEALKKIRGMEAKQ